MCPVSLATRAASLPVTNTTRSLLRAISDHCQKIQWIFSAETFRPVRLFIAPSPPTTLFYCAFRKLPDLPHSYFSSYSSLPKISRPRYSLSMPGNLVLASISPSPAVYSSRPMGRHLSDGESRSTNSKLLQWRARTGEPRESESGIGRAIAKSARRTRLSFAARSLARV